VKTTRISRVNPAAAELRRSADLENADAVREFEPELSWEVLDGTVLAFSDIHVDPAEPISTACRAVIELAAELQPKLICCAGDLLDLAAISRHPRIEWDPSPRVVDELRAGRDLLRQVADAAPEAALFFAIGNHERRWAEYLASQAVGIEGLPGAELGYWMPEWSTCFRLNINPQARFPLILKHRQAGGKTAAARNVQTFGTHVACGHTHQSSIVPHTNALGTIFGVDLGCCANVKSRLFARYTEAAPMNWRSSFGLFHFEGGEMVDPELVRVTQEDPQPGHGKIAWRGRTRAV
jgi:hypothetical protein